MEHFIVACPLIKFNPDGNRRHGLESHPHLEGSTFQTI